MFVLFWDMHSGGGCKQSPYEEIYIEAESESEAKTIFYNRFGHNPDRVTCTCCGPDYSVDSSETLEEATDYHRKRCGASDDSVRASVEEYLAREDVLLIRAEDILPDERVGEVPRQGYCWVD
jgi:hypothetical protein